MGESELEIYPPGTVLADSYEIVREVATGGMGTVYEARNVRLSKSRVAVKVLSKLTSRSSELLPRFRREAEIGAGLNHPHIVTVTDWNELPNGLPFFVMEYLEGESLSVRMRRETIARDLAMDILSDAGSALVAAHHQGVVHRDLKPSNVFLAKVEGRSKPFVKVLDFGISKLVFDETLETTSKLLGTPRYMAPEQVRNRPVDIRADEFALATIAYELFSGQLAFPGDSLEAILYHVVHDDPAPLRSVVPDLAPAWVAAIERGMAKDPEQRFDTIDDFLRAMRGGKGVGTPTEVCEAFQETTPASTPRALMETPRGLGAAQGDTVPDPPVARPLPRGSLFIAASLALAFGLLVGARWFGPADTSPPKDRSPVPAEQDFGLSRVPMRETARAIGSEPDRDGASDADAPRPARPMHRREPAPAVPEAPKAARRLDKAQAAFDAREYRSAIRFAEQSLIVQATPRAHRLITRSYCELKDLGAAKAAFHHVASQDKRRIATQCRRSGVDL